MTAQSLIFSDAPPPGWDATCRTERALFGSADWQGVLEKGFGCDTIYGWGESTRLAISIFKAGPFRVAYVGFPVGGTLDKTPVDAGQLLALRQAPIKTLPHVVRIPVSPYGDGFIGELPYVRAPETAIVDLQSWNLSSVSSNVRRDLRKAGENDVVIADASTLEHGRKIYRLYRDTVTRHKGSVRYTEAYFMALVDVATLRDDIRVLLALRNNEIAGFNVAARHGDTAYYLHGGFDRRFRDSRPAAPLMLASIEWARLGGCQIFNFLSSPSKQPQLVQYKEKWGGTTREHRTYTLPVRATYRLFRIAELAYRALG